MLGGANSVEVSVEPLLDLADLHLKSATLSGEFDTHLTAIAGVRTRTRNEPSLDEAVDQSTRVRAALADEQAAEATETERRVVAEHPQHLGLRGSQRELS